MNKILSLLVVTASIAGLAGAQTSKMKPHGKVKPAVKVKVKKGTKMKTVNLNKKKKH